MDLGDTINLSIVRVARAQKILIFVRFALVCTFSLQQKENNTRDNNNAARSDPLASQQQPNPTAVENEICT